MKTMNFSVERQALEGFLDASYRAVAQAVNYFAFC